jgi:hypothetical protein
LPLNLPRVARAADDDAGRPVMVATGLSPQLEAVQVAWRGGSVDI